MVTEKKRCGLLGLWGLRVELTQVSAVATGVHGEIQSLPSDLIHPPPSIVFLRAGGGPSGPLKAAL